MPPAMAPVFDRPLPLEALALEGGAVVAGPAGVGRLVEEDEVELGSGVDVDSEMATI